ncbi:sugar transferase [Panacibacter ginsenosidivorans]|nr:sugar transferase [Panacibacter ginsenosidivorans]
MEVNLLQKQNGVHESLLHIHLETSYPERKRSIEESLQQKKLQVMLKRIFDIVASSLLILFFSPILITVALIIKLTSKGPVLYSNERVGYRGINFRCFKFRSMVSDQSTRKSDYEIALAGQEKGILHKVKNDTRITWIGKIIRKTSIDELPQLFNVLIGDMSIIGPRPLVPFMLKHLPEFKEVRCLVRPGITGLWQIRDRINNTSAEFMIEHDTEYIENYSLIMDAKILLKTPIVVITGEGAY